MDTISKTIKCSIGGKNHRKRVALNQLFVIFCHLILSGLQRANVLRKVYIQDFERMWSSEETCYRLHKPRQFPVKTFAADKSEPALQYGKDAGIFDQVAAVDFNKPTPEQETILREKCQTANILIMNSLAYLNDGVFEQLLGWFESGKEPGILILAFNYPFDGVDRMRIQKSYLLKRFDFFNSLPLIDREMSEAEVKKLGNEFGVRDRLFYEIWFLTRKRK